MRNNNLFFSSLAELQGEVVREHEPSTAWSAAPGDVSSTPKVIRVHKLKSRIPGIEEKEVFIAPSGYSPRLRSSSASSTSSNSSSSSKWNLMDSSQLLWGSHKIGFMTRNQYPTY